MSSTASPKLTRGGLIVSIQPVRGGRFDDPWYLRACAGMAEDEGAVALRVEGLRDLATVKAEVDLPVIGLVKRNEPGTPVFITPTLQDVNDLAERGADIIAFDATDRTRPVSVSDMIAAIHDHGRLAMADLSTLEEGRAALAAGADFIATTLSGYTSEAEPPEGPDLALVEALAAEGMPVVAEGRIGTPGQAAAALAAGAMAVTVGTTLTRPEWVAAAFVRALRDQAGGVRDDGGSSAAAPSSADAGSGEADG